MGRIGLSLRAWWRTLTDAETASRVESALSETGPARIAAPEPPPPSEPPPAQNPALTLLAALQREARFVDFLKESLDGYDDAQIGAVARDVHREARGVVDRFFALEPVSGAEEGAEIDLPKSLDPGLFRLTGNVASDSPSRGTLQHHGWKAAQCELPSWSGSAAAANVVAPAEVEVK